MLPNEESMSLLITVNMLSATTGLHLEREPTLALPWHSFIKQILKHQLPKIFSLSDSCLDLPSRVL